MAAALLLGLGVTANAENYSRPYVNYTHLAYPHGSLDGLSAGYAWDINIGPKALFLEVGPELNLLFGKSTMFSVTAPVDVTYKFELGSGWAIAPLAGFNFRFNLLAKRAEGDLNLFDYGLKRFNFGMNFGVNAFYKKFTFGLKFTPDFTPMSDDAKDKANLFSIGVGFFF